MEGVYYLFLGFFLPFLIIVQCRAYREREQGRACSKGLEFRLKPRQLHFSRMHMSTCSTCELN